jgi:hypothetical protein
VCRFHLHIRKNSFFQKGTQPIGITKMQTKPNSAIRPRTQQVDKEENYRSSQGGER